MTTTSTGQRAGAATGASLGISAAAARRSASIIALAFVASRVLGLLREIILGYRFGTSSEYDAYVAAFRIPDLLFLVVMSGAFGAAFIPIFGRYLSRGEEDRAWTLASAVITFTAVTMTALSLVVFILAEPIMRYLVAPDLPADVRPLAVDTMRILLVSQILLGLSIAAKGILEAQDRFTLPALSPVLYNAAIILAALIAAPTYGIRGVAVGVVVGSLLHLLIQMPGLVSSGMRYTPVLSTRVAGLADVSRLLIPRVIGLAAFQLNFVAMTYLASGAGEGSVSALNYAWQMMMLPHGVVALSISTVIFPSMARLYEAGRHEDLRATFTGALTPLLFLLLPASVGLYELRTAIPQIVFQFGAFDARSTQLVSSALEFLALGLVWYGLVDVLARVFYAMQDTRTPVIAGIVIIVINVVLGALLVDSMGHGGLALALAASTGIEALILFALLRRRIGGLDDAFGGWFARVVIATAAMAAMAELIRPKLEQATTNDGSSRVLHLLMLGYAMVLLAGTYAVSSYLLGVPEVKRFTALAHGRVSAIGLGRR